VKAFLDMVRYVYDVVTEGSEQNSVCGQFIEDKSKLEDAGRIIKELRSQDTTLKTDVEQGMLLFNGQDISEEG